MAKRICLFAGYNSGNDISDYVLYYLKELKKFSDVYYCADGNLTDEQKSLLLQTVKCAVGKKHGKYDFGSWAELIKTIGWEKIATYDELLLVNDSCLGGVFPLEKMFTKMSTPKTQVWSAAGNHFMMSFFVDVKREVFLTDDFKNFFANIKKESNKSIIIKKYERGLSSLLEKYNTDIFLSPEDLKSVSLLQRKMIDEKIKAAIPPYLRYFFHPSYKKINLYDEDAVLPLLLEFPLVKKNLFKNKCSLLSVYAKELICQNSNYPKAIIENMMQNENIPSRKVLSVIMQKILFALKSFCYEEKYKKDWYIIRVCKIPVYRQKKDYSI